MGAVGWALFILMIGAWIAGGVFVHRACAQTYPRAWLLWAVGYPVVAGAVLWLIASTL